MNRQKLYQTAKTTLAHRRQAAELDALHRKNELYAQAPALAELDRHMTEAGATAASLAAEGRRAEADKKLAEVKLLAAKKEEYLASLSRGGGWLEPRFHCAICRDTGKKDGLACQCVHEEMKRLRREEIHQNSPLTLCRFENFKLDYYPEKMTAAGMTTYPRRTMAAILQDCREWATEFGRHSPSLYMFGYSGLGKTHLALSIATQVLEQGHDVVYVSAQSAFSTLLGTDREAGEELFRSLLGADLLVLDDLGTENVTAYLRARLYEIVNGRMGRRPTIYTSNICKREVLEGRYDEKIASRLLGDCLIMRFWGEDIRLVGKGRPE